MAGFASIATQISQALSSAAYEDSAVYLIKLDAQDQPVSYATLQYFPESLTDTKAVDWQSKAIPGGSLPLYQWTGSGERTISFTAQFSTDVDWFLGAAGHGGTDSFARRLETANQLKYNVDIRSAVAWLRSNMLPTYSGSPSKTAPPNKLMLYIPYSGIGIAGGENAITATTKDSIVCVQTSCEVTWEKFFPSGCPRLASVSLSFAQIPQFAGAVNFPASADKMKEAYAPNNVPNADNIRTNFLGYWVKSVAIPATPKPPRFPNVQ